MVLRLLLSVYIDWRSSYSLAFLCTRESKLRIFQFKFLHRRIATNSYLLKIGITSDNLWSFCKERSETMMHLFWECIFVQAFWNRIKQWMSERPCFPNDVFSFQSCLRFVDNASYFVPPLSPYLQISHPLVQINAPFPITSPLHTELSDLLRSGETLCSLKWKFREI